MSNGSSSQDFAVVAAPAEAAPPSVASGGFHGGRGHGSRPFLECTS